MIRTDRRAGSRRVAEVVGRANELGELSRFLDAAVAGPSVLLLEGEAGIGKTTLWQAGVAAARERSFWTLVCRPAEAEAKLGYAALGDLLEDVPDKTFTDLAAPQRRALDIALLRTETERGRADSRAISVALLNILRCLAESRTVIVAIDDTQWLDAASARALTFALRRIESEAVGLLAAQRLGFPPFANEAELAAQAERLTVGPLGREDVERVLHASAQAIFDRRTTDRIFRLSGGNPFYALEIARSLENSGALPADEKLAVPDSLRSLVGKRVAGFTPQTRRALLAAAAVSAPTISTVAVALGRRDGRVPALAPAVAADVVRIEGDKISFAHPLLAASVYADVEPSQRRRIHRRLAQAVEDGEERARHLALGTEAPNEQIARALVAAAARADARGAPESAAELTALASSLTPAGSANSANERRVATAAYLLTAGDTAAAGNLLEELIDELGTGPTRAQALLLYARTRVAVEGFESAKPPLERAIPDAGRDPRLRAEIMLWLARCHARTGERVRSAEIQRSLLPLAEQIGDPDLLADCRCTLARVEFLLGNGFDRDMFERGLALPSGAAYPIHEAGRLNFVLTLLCVGALEDARSQLETLHVWAIDSGNELRVPQIVSASAELEFRAGNWARAAELADEALAAATRTEQKPARIEALQLKALIAAHRGDVAGAHALVVEVFVSDVQALDSDDVRHQATLGFLALSQGDHVGALELLRDLPERRALTEIGEPTLYSELPDLIEAAIAAGEPDLARRHIAWLEERGRTLARAWASAVAARNRALLAAAEGNLGAVLASLDQALAEHERVPIPFERGRTLLALGAVQRRAKQRRTARASLSQAVKIFDELGAPLWADRARDELARIGGRASGDELTPTEAQVAARAAAGETNREIAQALFMSVKTVESNLSRVYRKLDISSRRQLNNRVKQQK